MVKKEKFPRIKNILILAKHEDDKIRQIVIDEDMQNIILNAILQCSKDGKITVVIEPIESIDWTTEVDLLK